MHPTRRDQLPHAGIHERIAGASLAPRGEARMRTREREIAHTRLQREIRRVFEEPTELQEKVALHESAHERVERRAFLRKQEPIAAPRIDTCEQRARGDDAERERGRESRRCALRRNVSRRAICERRAGEIRIERRERRELRGHLVHRERRRTERARLRKSVARKRDVGKAHRRVERRARHGLPCGHVRRERTIARTIIARALRRRVVRRNRGRIVHERYAQPRLFESGLERAIALHRRTVVCGRPDDGLRLRLARETQHRCGHRTSPHHERRAARAQVVA
jgi:hypothetical protein